MVMKNARDRLYQLPLPTLLLQWWDCFRVCIVWVINDAVCSVENADNTSVTRNVVSKGDA